MKKYFALFLAIIMCFGMVACNNHSDNPQNTESTQKPFVPPEQPEYTLHQSGVCNVDGTSITFSNNGITVNGNAISENTTDAVYAAKDIVYYEDGKDFTYGAGTVDDIRSNVIAGDHTVVHITEPGNYIISGELTAGQIFVDLGADAQTEVEQQVTIYLNGVSMKCEVAPVILFKNAYNSMLEDSEFGANIVVCEQSINILNGDYVACIYESDSIEMNADNTAVEKYTALHDYCGAIYSTVSLKITGKGVVTVNGSRDGIATTGHLIANGPSLFVNAARYGMHVTNENVLNIQEGNVTATAKSNYETIALYSQGWININGGNITALVGDIGGSRGMYALKEVIINRGNVFSTSAVEQSITSKQKALQFHFDVTQPAGYIAIHQGNDSVARNITETFTFLYVSAGEFDNCDYSISHNNNPYRLTPLTGDIVVEDPEKDVYSEVFTITDQYHKFFVKTGA